MDTPEIRIYASPGQSLFDLVGMNTYQPDDAVVEFPFIPPMFRGNEKGYVTAAVTLGQLRDALIIRSAFSV